MSSENRQFNTKKIVIVAMLSAIAWVLASIIKLPIVPAVAAIGLGYEPKDVVLVIAGFLYGPVVPLIMATLLSVIEMITTSLTGWLGAIQNFLSSCVFCCTAAIIYNNRRTLISAVTGLAVATLLTSAVMMVSNYFLVPVYLSIYLGIMDMDSARNTIKDILWEGFLVFNLLKYTLNTALTMIIYKRTRNALRTARLLPVAQEPSGTGSVKKDVIILGASVMTIAVCIFIVLALNDMLW